MSGGRDMPDDGTVRAPGSAAADGSERSDGGAEAAGLLARLDAMPPAWPIVLVALAQGLVLFALYRASHGALGEAPRWAVPLWTLALTVPSLFVLSVGIGEVRRLLAALALHAVLVAVLGARIGLQMEPANAFPTSGIVLAWIVTMMLATFLTLLWLQWFAVGAPRGAGRDAVSEAFPDYRLLVAISWRGLQVPVLALAFTGLFAAVLMVWAGLFSVIGIDLFRELFRRDWFLFPMLGLAFGLGVLAFRRLAQRLGRIDALLRSLMVLLLPLALLIAVSFVLMLPFTGLQPLWDTGRGTLMLLWLLVLILAFVNGVHQDGRLPSPYPPWLDRALVPALAVLPVIALLAGWGLALRVNQYGLSVDRFWGLLVWALLAAWSLGYAVLAAVALWRRRDWALGLGSVNSLLGAALLVLMLLVNSPLLDPRKLALASQLARVQAGELALEELDFAWMHRSLGAPGQRALARLRAEHADDAALIAAMDRAPSGQRGPVRDDDAMIDALRLRPEPFEIDPALRAALANTGFMLRAGTRGTSDSTLLRVDLDRDGRADYLLLHRDGGMLFGTALLAVEDGFETRGLRVDGLPDDPAAVIRALEAAEPEPVQPRVDDVLLGPLRIRVDAPIVPGPPGR